MNKSALGFLFSKYLWGGMLLLTISLLIQENIDESRFVWTTIVELVKTVSISIIVASIFTYTLGTVEFLDNITKLLENVVVSRKFLGNLSGDSKKQALKSLLESPDRDKDIYQHIEKYYEDYIRDTLNIANKNVRSNYSIAAQAFFDDELGRVGVKALYSYRLYPSVSGYRELKIGFDEGDDFSKVDKVVINKPDGTRQVIDDIVFKEETKAGSKDRVMVIDLNKYGDKYDHLDIEAYVTEFGADHWFMFTFKALQPTDGFRFHLKCGDNLEVRTYSVFDTGKAYHVDKIGNQELGINCFQWIKEGVGLSALISYPHTLDVESVLAARADAEAEDNVVTTNTHVT
ncbi:MULTISPECIES: hypothetical protein [unclassified Halomonas]|uniref:hypothetical protein n=1 Tax=unclassified Halomonas TaxID=2609666 RepID=UPI0004844A62|nr:MULTISPECIES: hypothetical protein [unclassified Halomonas]PKH60747.1 hypothetical protein CXF94_13830 [Halomonas sp. Choline-3u-9]QGQ72139.1 hypothetical protein FDY98_22825 [Halomonas sp. PA16-9]|tara:strand:- start:2537 stop:3571 length:1035 start_codon:yes stop_codon:yes gene_type:complete